MTKNHWLIKSEPETYSWTAFLKEGGTAWTGVRNYQARNHLRAMKKGDLVLFYHSGEERHVAGLARVEREAYPDPTATEGDWSCVDVVPMKPLQRTVTLAEIKSETELQSLPLLRNSRLSVTPLSEAQFRRVMEMAGTKP